VCTSELFNNIKQHVHKTHSAEKRRGLAWGHGGPATALPFRLHGFTGMVGGKRTQNDLAGDNPAPLQPNKQTTTGLISDPSPKWQVGVLLSRPGRSAPSLTEGSAGSTTLRWQKRLEFDGTRSPTKKQRLQRTSGRLYGAQPGGFDAAFPAPDPQYENITRMRARLGNTTHWQLKPHRHDLVKPDSLYGQSQSDPEEAQRENPDVSHHRNGRGCHNAVVRSYRGHD